MGLFGKAMLVAELDRLVFITRTLSRDWVGYSKAEFLGKMPGTWYGATAEDRGAYVVVRNAELFRRFEFHFMFGEEQDACMTLLVVRGLQEMQDIWILGQSGEVAFSLRPPDGKSVSRDARKAADILQKKLGVSCIPAQPA